MRKSRRSSISIEIVVVTVPDTNLRIPNTQILQRGKERMEIIKSKADCEVTCGERPIGLGDSWLSY